MYLNRDLGGVRRVASQPVAKITTDSEPCMTMLLEKLRKSDRSLEDCCLSATYVQVSAMVAAGEWRDEVGCSKLTSVSLAEILIPID